MLPYVVKCFPSVTISTLANCFHEPVDIYSSLNHKQVKDNKKKVVCVLLFVKCRHAYLDRASLLCDHLLEALSCALAGDHPIHGDRRSVCWHCTNAQIQSLSWSRSCQRYLWCHHVPGHAFQQLHELHRYNECTSFTFLNSRRTVSHIGKNEWPTEQVNYMAL